MCYSMMVEQDLKKLALQFDAEADEKAFKRYGSMAIEQPKTYKSLEDNPRIYPNYFAPIITLHKGKRLITPMRYRVRPAGSEKEVPSKYNMFNARIDSLQKRQSWRGLFMRSHGILPFNGFFEWVSQDGKKQVIQFKPQSGQTLAAPVIFDTWISADRSTGFASFAVITREPPPEVLTAGHDRCPISLVRDSWEPWLSCHGSPEAMLKLIDCPPDDLFDWENAAP